MRTILLFISFQIFLPVVGQPRAYQCDYTTEITDSNYVIIWRECRHRKKEVSSEGPVQSSDVITRFNYGNYRHGVWKQYDLEDNSVATIEYYLGLQIGTYLMGSPDGTYVDGYYCTYSIVKSGISTITYYGKHGRVTQIDSFDLNDPEKITIKVFYDINGNVLNKETWKNGIKID